MADAGNPKPHEVLSSKQSPAQDRRIARTRRQLLESLMTLMIEKGYEAITVQHIIDRANVGRSTFYSHFLDKQDLLQSGIDQLRLTLAEHSPSAALSGDPAAQPLRLAFTLAMFQHAQGHYDLYRAMVGRQSGALVQQLMKEMFGKLLKREFEANPVCSALSPTQQDLLIQYVVSSLLSLLTWWLDQKMPFSAEKMDETFHLLTMPGMAAMLSRIGDE